MSSSRNLEVTIRQYLLGQLTGEAFEQFEEQLFADDDLFEQVLVTEDELIDESIAGELSQAEGELFAKNFVNSQEREKKLLFREALKNYVKNAPKPYAEPKPKGFWFSLTYSFRTALTAVAVVVIAALLSLVPLISHWTTRAPTFATINLTISANNRAEAAQAVRVKLPLGVDELRLRLSLPEPLTPAKSFHVRVELVKVTGETQTLGTVTQDETSVVVAIAASQLERGQYALNLHVTKPGEPEQRIAGSYYFTVE
jgi:hypothetical protein